jgi:predicted transcriptional regulator
MGIFINPLYKDIFMKIIIQKSEDAIKVLNLLSNLTMKKIIDFLKEHGQSSPSKIAKELNISPSTASRCLHSLKEYNLLKARWVTESIDERPLKIYELVPNIIRFEYVLNEPRLGDIKPEHIIIFKGSSLIEFKEDEKRGVYVSLESVPFRFEGLTADILKETTKQPNFEYMKNRYKDNEVEFEKSLKKLLRFGLIEIKKP